MKKVILILAALMLVVSGIAAVSAYEAHTINVRSHVENAMHVSAPVLGLDFGTVFPEEWVTKEFKVGVSTSFCERDQIRVLNIDYDIYLVLKVLSEGPPVAYYPWLGDCLYIGVDAINKWPTTAIHPGPGDLVPAGNGAPPILILSDSLTKPRFGHPEDFDDSTDTITVGIDTPVFEGYYNMYTDPEPKPSGLNDPTVVILKSDTDRYFPDGVTLGADIVIQITRIWNHLNP